MFNFIDMLYYSGSNNAHQEKTRQGTKGNGKPRMIENRAIKTSLANSVAKNQGPPLREHSNSQKRMPTSPTAENEDTPPKKLRISKYDNCVIIIKNKFTYFKFKFYGHVIRSELYSFAQEVFLSYLFRELINFVTLFKQRLLFTIILYFLPFLGMIFSGRLFFSWV